MNKKYFALFAGLPLLLTGCSKTPGPKKISRYHANGELLQVNTIKYRGNSIEENVEEFYEENKVQSTTKTVATFDGNLIEKETTFYYNPETKIWGEIYYSYFAYNSQGRLLSKYETIIGEKGELPFSFQLFRYDEYGRETANEMYDYFNNQFFLFTKIETEYNQKGQKSKEYQYSNIAGNYELSCYYVYNYEQNGALNNVSEFDSKNKLVSVNRYEYNEKTLSPLSMTIYRLENNQELPRIRYDYEYNSKNEKTKESYSLYDDEAKKFVLDEYTVFQY